MNAGSRNHVAWVILGHLCAICAAAFFLYAAYGKIIQPRQFAISIKNYHILPVQYVNLPAIFMPWWEVGAAVALLIPRTRRAGAILVGGMLVLFIAAVGYSALYLGLKISCGCTGEGSAQAGWLTIGRNVILLALTIASVYLSSQKRRTAGDVPHESYGLRVTEQPV